MSCPFRSNYGTGTDVDCVGANCQLWYGNNCVFMSMGGDLDTTATYLKHMHDSHQDFHYFPHKCDQVPASCGMPATSNFFPRIHTPYASVLISEYFNSEDLDENGLRYGYDFVISDDVNKPPQLSSMEKYPTFVRPSREVSWLAILSWWKDGGVNPLE